MSPISNDSIHCSSPFLASFSNETLELGLTSTRIPMETTLANSTNFAPAPFSVLGGSDREFTTLLGDLKAELAPKGLVEALLVDRVLLAVSRLRSIVDQNGDDEGLALAEQSIDRALEALTNSRANRAEGWGRAATSCSRVGDCSSLAPLPGGPEALPIDAENETESKSETNPADGHWRDRLTFDGNVSDESPVVRGTWVTAGQIVSLIVDSWSWEDILRNFPELTERDIRACLAYTVEQDGPIHL